MTYEEIVAKVKKAYAKADTALVDEHLAVQVDVTGEGEGAFYIEVAEGKITVEPFEYYDHDFKVLCTGEEIIAIAEGKKKLSAEVEAGNAYVSRDVDKVAVFDLIVAKKAAAKKAPAKKAADEKKPAAKKAPAKKEAPKAKEADDTKKKAAKKPAVKKEAAKVEEAVKEVKEEVKAEVTAAKEEVKAVATADAKKKPGRKPAAKK